MRCITFRRWFPGQDRDPESFTYPMETDADKILLSQSIVQGCDGDMSFFVEDRMETTNFIVKTGDRMVYRKRCVQFYQYDYHEDDYCACTFPIETDSEKIAFAEWVIEHKFAEFRQANTDIFTSQIHLAPAVNGQPVLAPVAEVVQHDATSPPAASDGA